VDVRSERALPPSSQMMPVAKAARAAHGFGLDLALPGAEIELELFELVFSITRRSPPVVEREELDRFGPCGAAVAGSLAHEHRCLLFPAALVRIELVVHLDFGDFREAFVEGAALVWLDRAEQKSACFGKARRPACRRAFRALRACRQPAADCRRGKSRFSKPDEFFTAEERESQQRFDGLVMRCTASSEVLRCHR